MKKSELEQAVKEIDINRVKMQKQLLDFAETDLLFFFSDKPELVVWQQQKWQPIIEWAEELFGIKIHVTSELAVPDNHELKDVLPKMFQEVSDKEFCCWYAATLNLRSVLLGLAMIKGKISAQKATELSYLEELWQNEQWGEDEQALSVRRQKNEELSEIESFLQCAM